MNGDPRIDDILDQWEEARDDRKPKSVEALCRDCPELAAEVRRQIRELERVDEVFDIQPHHSSHDLDELPQTLGRYRLDEQIGEGGFGQVWKGYDPELERVVAIKVLKPECGQSVLQVDRFLSEAKKVARLQHKNIVAVHDVGREDRWCYMVTDLINGRDLAYRLSIDRVTPQEAIEIVSKIADALHHAHEHGIIHRDVKPHNILLNKDREPFITDFGIAITEAELLDGDSDTAGSPAYMAPEQASLPGTAVDARTDVYGLGIVLYELLVGTVPYAANTLPMLRQSLQTREVSNPADANPDVSLELSRVCLKAMSIDPDDRWESAGEFAVQLRQLPTSETSQQPSPSSSQSERLPADSQTRRRRDLKKFLKEVIRDDPFLLVLFVFVGIVFVWGAFVGFDVWLHPPPLEVTFRESVAQQGLVAMIKNTSEKPVFNIKVGVFGSKIRELPFRVVESGETIEVSEASLGFALSSGDYLLIAFDGARNGVGISANVP